MLSYQTPSSKNMTCADAEAVFPQLQAVSFHQEFNSRDLGFRFKRVGHILGAGSLIAKHQNTSIIFSGDLGRDTDPCVLPPEDNLGADYLVIESTYGDRLHEKIDSKESLRVVVNRVFERGGTVIIPAFAVGRTQTILYDIYIL